MLKDLIKGNIVAAAIAGTLLVGAVGASAYFIGVSAVEHQEARDNDKTIALTFAATKTYKSLGEAADELGLPETTEVTGAFSPVGGNVELKLADGTTKVLALPAESHGYTTGVISGTVSDFTVDFSYEVPAYSRYNPRAMTTKTQTISMNARELEHFNATRPEILP